MSLKLGIREAGDVTVVDLAGRVTLGEETNALRAALSDLIARNRRKILLNMADVTFIDSSGIRELASALKALKENGGTLKLLKPTKRVQDLLQITKLYTIFDIQDDEAAAVASFTC